MISVLKSARRPSAVVRILALGVSLAALGINGADADQTATKLEHFAALPYFSEAKLSPNGQQIAYITAHEQRRVLVMQDIDGSNQVAIPPAPEADVLWHRWASDSRVLILYEFSMRKLGQHVQATQTRLAAIDRDGQNFAWIVEPEKIPGPNSRTPNVPLEPPQLQGDILHMLPDDPDHILLSLDADHNGSNEIRKINIHTGKYKIIRDDQRGVQNWFLDHHGTIRRGTGFDMNKWTDRVKDASGEWRQVADEPWHKRFYINGFTEDPNVVFVAGRGDYGTDGLFKLSLDSGEITETVFEHPKVDIDYLVTHPYTEEPIGAAYTIHRQKIQYFHKTWVKVQNVIDKALPSTNNLIVSKARGQHIYLVLAFSDIEPGVYYYLDLKAKKLEVISPTRPQIDPNQSATIHEVSIPMRDGTEIPAYLTLPRGTEKTKKLPTIVMPHGGPEARSTADWNFFTQFFASRGYAVLEPNFRGSTGYGDKHLYAGIKQWGGLMQDDVTDATKWLISEKIADKKRICIVGASYGGYAALMGVIKEPKLYQCAASINGVTDIPELKTDDKHFLGGRAWIKKMGMRDMDDQQVSPYHRAQDIDAAVLLISSKDDSRIDYRLSKNMHDRLSKLGKDSEYVALEDGGHHMDTGASRLGALQALEPFLAKHLHK